MFEAMALEADEGLTLTAYTAEPGTPSHDGLKVLASWAATRQDDASAQDSRNGLPGVPVYGCTSRDSGAIAAVGAQSRSASPAARLPR
jgi:hypothetical protein